MVKTKNLNLCAMKYKKEQNMMIYTHRQGENRVEIQIIQSLNENNENNSNIMKIIQIYNQNN